MQKAIVYPRIKEDRPTSIINYSNIITSLVTTIESLNRPDYLISPTLRDQLIEKLPIAMKLQLAQFTLTPLLLTIEQLTIWLERQAGAGSAFTNPFSEAKQGRAGLC